MRTHCIREAVAFLGCAALATTLVPATAQAEPVTPAVQQDSLIASYDFTDGTAKDSIGGHDLQLEGGAKVEAYGDRDNNKALSLRGNGQYAQFPEGVFDTVGNDFTMEFSAKSRAEDSGDYFTFALGKDSTRYLFMYLSTQSAKAVISDDKWNNEQGFKEKTDGAGWHQYKLVVAEGSLALFSDNQLVGYKKTDLTLADLQGSTAYLGKSFYSNDKYWDGAIDDLKIYDDAEPIQLAESVAVAGEAVNNGSLSLTEGEESQLTASVAPQDSVSSAVAWSSSDNSVASVSDAGKVTAKKMGTATITATPQYGDGTPGSVTVTVEAPSDEVLAKYAQEDLEAAYASLPQQTTENLPLASSGAKHGSEIIWTSDNTDVVSSTQKDYVAPKSGAADPYKGAGIINRAAYGDGDRKASLKATAALAGQVAVGKSQEVIVKETPRSAPDAGYAAATFESDNNGGEKIWISSTEGHNFFSFKTRNNGDPAIESDADTGGLRDAFILRSHGGDKYYLIATDLKVSAQGWGQNQQFGSRKIEAYESTDLVHWTRTNGDGNGGITVNSPEAGMTWAPEAYWDDSLQSYIVFFSSRMFTDETRTTPTTNATTGRSSYAQVRFSLTRDFVHYTEPQTWQDTGYSRIDSTVMKIGKYYYRFTKNEEGGSAGGYISDGKTIFLERSEVLTAPTTEASPDNDPATGWQLLEQNMLPFEGPEVVKLNDGDPLNTKDHDGYIVLSDNFSYRAFMTTGKDLAGISWKNPITSKYPDFKDESKPITPAPGANGFVAKGAEGGLPEKVRHGAFTNVPQTVLDAMKGWTAISAVKSITKAQYDEKSRTVTASVSAADEGDIAGSVTMKAGDWTSTVKVANNGIATMVLPASVSGDVSVVYDGYRDALVESSQTKVMNVAAAPQNPDEPETPGEDSTNDADTPSESEQSEGNQSSLLTLSHTGAAIGAAVFGVLALGAVGVGLVLSRKHSQQ